MIWVFIQLQNPSKNQILIWSAVHFLRKGQLSFIPHGVQTIQKKRKKKVDSVVQETNKKIVLHDLFISASTFSFPSKILFVWFLFNPGARTETRTSISDQNLQCSLGMCERVSNPNSFDDYLQTMAVYKGIKEGNGAFIWEHTQSHSQGQSTTFSLPHDLYKLNSFKYSVEESDLLKVHKKNPHFLLSLPDIFASFSLWAWVYCCFL